MEVWRGSATGRVWWLDCFSGLEQFTYLLKHG